MKKILFLILMFVCSGAFAAEGLTVFETATSSMSVASVSISTSAYTLVSVPNTSSQDSSSGLYISWYSTTLYNVNSSTFSYVFSSSDSSAPAAATPGAPIGSGSETSPQWVTEQFQGIYMWVKCHGSSAANLVVVRRGR